LCKLSFKSVIDDSYTFFQASTETLEFFSHDYKVITAANNLSNISIIYKDLLLNLVTDVDNGGLQFFSLEVSAGLYILRELHEKKEWYYCRRVL
jgi:hypothetical protein